MSAWSDNPRGHRSLNILLLLLALFWIGVAAFIFVVPWIDNYRIANARAEVMFDFAASNSSIVFPVALGPNEQALLVIDRASGTRHLVRDPDAGLRYPVFADDNGGVLWVVRRPRGFDELLRCTTADWSCARARTFGEIVTIVSPTPVGANGVMFAASFSSQRTDASKLARADGNFDLYLIDSDQSPTRLTYFQLNRLYALNVTNDELIFSGGAEGNDKALFPSPPNPPPASSSTIFRLKLEGDDRRIPTPTFPQEPYFQIGGYSTAPTASPDGRFIAFLNIRNDRYNLAIAPSQGDVQRYIETKGLGFSRAAFAGGRVLANEIFDDHYETRSFDLGGQSDGTPLTIDNSPTTLRQLNMVNLTVR